MESYSDEEVGVSPLLKGLIVLTVSCIFLPLIASVVCWQRRNRKGEEEHR
ncbi:MAG: hypothetical protein ACK55Z_06830 [bacterium]